jgi:hypothetical protein
MNAHVRIRRSSPSPAARANGPHQVVAASIRHPYSLAPIEQAAEQTRAQAAPNPLWVIAIGMGVFFAATALIMMFD